MEHKGDSFTVAISVRRHSTLKTCRKTDRMKRDASSSSFRISFNEAKTRRVFVVTFITASKARSYFRQRILAYCKRSYLSFTFHSCNFIEQRSKWVIELSFSFSINLYHCTMWFCQERMKRLEECIFMK